MRRKTKAIIAVTLAACMTLSSTVFAFAEDVTEVTASGGDEVTVDNVTESGVTAYGEGTKVEVKEDVTSDGTGIFAGINPDTYDIEGGTTVTVKGNVTSGTSAGNGVDCTDSEVHVGGNVVQRSSEGEGVVVGGDFNNASSTALVTVEKNVESANIGISAHMGGTAVVEGDVSGRIGVEVNNAYENSNTQNAVVVVEGTVKGTEDAVLFNISETATSQATVLAYKVDGSVSKKIYDNNTLTFGDKSDASDLINYILVKESDKITGYDSGTTSYTVNGKTYDTAKEGASVVIKVSEGYGVKAGTIEVTKNADGTFTLIVPKGGGVTITAEAIQEAVKEAEETGKGEAKVDDNKDKSEKKPEEKSDSSKKDDDDDDNSNNATQFTTAPQTAATTTTAMTKVRTATVDPSSADYSAKVVELIASVPANGSLDLNITNSAYLDAAIINALMTRNDVSVNLIITFMGYPYKLTIPAGYSLEGLIGADGKIDFAKLIKTFPPKAK